MSEVICIYGLGRGESYSEFKEWLLESKGHYLVFLEDEDVSDRALQHAHLLHDPQVRVYFFSPLNEEEIFKQIAWEFVFASFSYRIGPDDERHQQRGAQVFEKMSFFQSGVALVVSDYADFGVKVLSNFRKNSYLLPQAARGTALYKAFRGVPAIVCGGGPSLTSALPLLKEMEDRALIFAGGAALTILSHHQIAAHFGAGVDPHFSEERFVGQTQWELPFFYQDRISHELLKRVHGPRLWIPDGGGYLLERYFSEKLGLADTPFDAGWTVGNFCTTLSHMLGCDPIILVGMDLCVKEGKAYAEGIEDKEQVKEWITVQSPEGEMLYSKRDWVMSAGWTETFAMSFPGIHLIDSTEGGIGFKGIEKLSLDEAVNQFCSFSLDLKAKVSSHIQNIEKTKLSFEEVSQFWKEVDESLSRCQSKCALLLELIGQAYPESPQGNGIFVVNQVEFEEEIVYTKILQPIWNIWQYLFKREMGEMMDNELGQLINKLLFFQKVMERLWTDMK